jgi:hypothetical protein
MDYKLPGLTEIENYQVVCAICVTSAVSESLDAPHCSTFDSLEFREQERSVAGAWISTAWAGIVNKSISDPQQGLPIGETLL